MLSTILYKLTLEKWGKGLIEMVTTFAQGNKIFDTRTKFYKEKTFGKTLD